MKTLLSKAIERLNAPRKGGRILVPMKVIAPFYDAATEDPDRAGQATRQRPVKNP